MGCHPASPILYPSLFRRNLTMGRLPASTIGSLPICNTIRRLVRICLGVMILLVTAKFQMARAGELDTLRKQKSLTPEKLLRFFADFKFELGERVQDAETFLRRKSGDCDD